MKVKAAYTRLLVSDLEACFQFYRDVLEFPVTIEDFPTGYAEFAAGEMKLALFRRQEMAEIVGKTHMPAHVDCQDRVQLIFIIPNLDEVYQHIKSKGVNFTTEPMNNPYYGLKIAYLRDPDENLIGLFQPLV